MSYRELWGRLVALVSVAGLLLALALFDPLAVMGSLAGACAVVFIVLVGVENEEDDDATVDWAALRWRTAVCACLAVGLPGACMISASATLFLAVALSVSSPPAIAWVRRACAPPASRRSAGRGEQVTRMLEQGPTPGLIASMDTATLCAAWERSFPMLSAASTVRERLLVAHLRQLYLDELDRRHPTSFATWLSTHPTAWSGPGQFLPDA